VLVTLLFASVARAQQPGAPPAAAVAPAPAFWELISGYEADTEGSGYGFFGPSYVRPIRPGLSWTARAFGNYLSYQFSDLDGATHVKSPGVSTAAGLQFGDRQFFRLLAGPELKWRRTEITGPAASTRTDTQLGANFGSEVYANPTSHNNIQGLVNYNTTDRYSWGRLGFKEQVNNHAWQGANTAFVGIEGIAQGNHDIRSKQVGGFFELTHVPAKVSMVFKAGFKQSTFEVGPAKTGPYFSVGFYRRMN
jgi:outer membrane protein assembly factor BamA